MATSGNLGQYRRYAALNRPNRPHEPRKSLKTIADFRRDNGASIRAACARFILICRQLGLFAHAVAAIDGSKLKGANARERNFTKGKLKRRVEQVEESIGRYLQSLDAADLQEGEIA